jgi:hypothetical protein
VAFTRYYNQAITAPAGTTPAAPAAVALTLETNHLDRIEIDVPDGHDRQTGIRILSNGTVIVPFSLNDWIVANNHYFTIPFDDDITTGDLVLQAYNQDVFDHTFYVRFVMANSAIPLAAGVVSTAGTVTLPPATADQVAQLAAAPTAADAGPPPVLAGADLALLGGAPADVTP